MLLEMKSLRSHWEISLLCLLLVFGASRGMPQPREHGTDWQHCKRASQEIIQQLWKLGVKPLALCDVAQSKSHEYSMIRKNPLAYPFLLKLVSRIKVMKYGDVMKTTVPDLFPKIECEDHCDPESLGNDNKMYCLEKISQGLHHYHNLLRLYFPAQNINDLQSALKKLSSLLQEDPDVTERIHPSKNNTKPWELKPLQQHTLWRLQSFSVVVARVFAHSAALSMNIQQ